jgi:seryl-tRNA synthetase
MSGMSEPLVSRSIQEEIQELKCRLQLLQKEAERELRRRLKKARAVIEDLENQLAEITGGLSTCQIHVAKRVRTSVIASEQRQDNGPGRRRGRPSQRLHITDEQLRAQIICVLRSEGREGIAAKAIAEKLKQSPYRISQFIRNYPETLKRGANGHGRIFLCCCCPTL